MRKRILSLLTAAAIVVSFTGCAPQGTTGNSSENKETQDSQTEEEEKQTIKIGAVYPLTGTSAETGNQTINTLKAMAELINNEYDIDYPFAKTQGLPNLGNARIEIIAADSQGNPEVGATEAERLITEEKVTGLIGCDASGVTKTASAVAEKYGIPFINAESSSPTLTERGLKYFFRTGPTDATFVEDTFNYMDLYREEAGFENVAIIADEAEAGVNFKELCEAAAENHGYNIVQSITYPGNPTGLTSEVLKLKDAKPDVVLIYALTAEAILYTNTCKDLDFSPKATFTARGGFVATEYFDTCGKDVDYIFTANAWSMDLANTKPYLTEINNLAKKFSNHDMTGNTARAAQGFLIFADAINRAGSADADAIVKALEETDMNEEFLIVPWTGVTFDESHQNTQATGIITQIQNQAYVTVYPDSAKSADSIIPVPAWSERN